MTDDLVKQLRDMARMDGCRASIAAADRIEALTAQLSEEADVRTQIDARLEELVAQVDALTAERDRFQRAFAAQSAKVQIALDVGGEPVRAALLQYGDEKARAALNTGKEVMP